jgi:glycosyltransferase involved in cell wall biosynthesis
MNIYLLSEEWIRLGKIFDYLIMRMIFPRSIQKADHIVTISKSTQKDLIKYFPMAENKSTIIYPGFNKKIYKTSPYLSKNGGSDDRKNPYFLYVGVLSPTKNLERSIRAFNKFNEKSDIKYSFILAGRNDGKYLEKALKPLVKYLKLESFVKFYGFVSEEELNDLYAKAFCLLYPSLREGFGYPILEAMYLGIPVITSNVSSCPEVAGDAAIYVDPLSEEELFQAMNRITENKKLREDMIKRGDKRYNEFSLTVMANKYLTLFDYVSSRQSVADK